MNGTVQARDDVKVEGDRAVEVRYFTDPYCSWCWATEPVWLHLQEAYGSQVRFRVVMGGLVERAGDMLGEGGERLEWLRTHMQEVAERSGQPIDPSFLDQVDDQFSTWPACIHVKAADLQSEDYGQRLLRNLRRGIMVQQTRASDLVEAARCTEEVEGLDTTQWRGALADGSALQAFLADRHRCSEAGVSGFPTILIRSNDGASRRIVGYRGYSAVEAELRAVAPWLKPRPTRDLVDLLFDHGPLTAREVQELLGLSPAETFQTLDKYVAQGVVETAPDGRFWQLVEQG